MAPFGLHVILHHHHHLGHFRHLLPVETFPESPKSLFDNLRALNEVKMLVDCISEA